MSIEVEHQGPARPTCAYVPKGHPSPWKDLVDYYFSHTDMAERMPAGEWRKADTYWPAAWVGDAQADPLAAAMLDGQVSRPQFEAALSDAEAAQQHPALAEFVDHARRLPEGLDFAAAVRGAQLYGRLPPLATTIHGIVGGFLYAAMQPNAALALAASANIAKATHRRYMRTAQYVLDITEPTGLAFGGVGCASACRVRLVHGFVRTEIGRHAAWDTEQYGAPIHPVSTLLAASVTGTWALLNAERMGCRFTEQEREDMAMFTALQAHYQGVSGRLIPLRHRDWAEYTFWALWNSGLPSDADRPRALTVVEPLVRNGYPFSDSPIAHHFFNATIVDIARRTFGDGICERFEIPKSPLGRGAYRVLQPSLALHVAANNLFGHDSPLIRERTRRTKERTQLMVTRTLEQA